MNRLAPKITLDEFKVIIDKKFCISEGGFEPYEMFMDDPIIEKDLSKINFDLENCSVGNADPEYDDGGYCEYPVGYEVLSNGLPVLFVNAGGDWECPICFCLYYDGKYVRAYIPKNGNLYNKKEKCAYGSEDFPLDNYDEINNQNGDPEKIREDVVKRIKLI